MILSEQTHHISYDPEITTIVTVKEHERIHGHGTGQAKGSKRKAYLQKIVITKSQGEVRFIKLGDTYIPKFARQIIGLATKGDVANIFTGPNIILLAKDGMTYQHILRSIGSLVHSFRIRYNLQEEEIPSLLSLEKLEKTEE